MSYYVLSSYSEFLNLRCTCISTWSSRWQVQVQVQVLEVLTLQVQVRVQVLWICTRVQLEYKYKYQVLHLWFIHRSIYGPVSNEI